MSEPAQRQLALNIRLREAATFDSFVPSLAHGPLLAALKHLAEGAGEPLIYLHGPAGSGRTHLLQATCRATAAPLLYLPLEELGAEDPAAVFDGMDQMGLVALDDLDSVAGDARWEGALFRFFNLARESGCRLLLAADRPPSLLDVALPDLRSRLGWGEVYAVHAPDPALCREVLRTRARLRGIALPEEVSDFILNRARRDVGGVLEVLERLDRASLEQQRALSIPFVKRGMGW
jgi:DnaA family protein